MPTDALWIVNLRGKKMSKIISISIRLSVLCYKKCFSFFHPDFIFPQDVDFFPIWLMCSWEKEESLLWLALGRVGVGIRESWGWD